jgi:cytochrome b6-f complex subunit 8
MIAPMLITLGWAALAASFTFSIAMVIWGRNGDNTLNF